MQPRYTENIQDDSWSNFNLSVYVLEKYCACLSVTMGSCCSTLHDCILYSVMSTYTRTYCLIVVCLISQFKAAYSLSDSTTVESHLPSDSHQVLYVHRLCILFEAELDHKLTTDHQIRSCNYHLNYMQWNEILPHNTCRGSLYSTLQLNYTGHD